MIEASHLQKRFGTLVAVNDVSLTVMPGQILGLLGPNGAGKTTTISMMAGLLTPDSGEVRINGRSLSGDTDDNKRKFGLVPQDLALYGRPETLGRSDMTAPAYRRMASRVRRGTVVFGPRADRDSR